MSSLRLDVTVSDARLVLRRRSNDDNNDSGEISLRSLSYRDARASPHDERVELAGLSVWCGADDRPCVSGSIVVSLLRNDDDDRRREVDVLLPTSSLDLNAKRIRSLSSLATAFGDCDGLW